MSEDIYSINIELTARCHADCKICARKNMRQPEVMDMDSFTVEEIIKGIKELKTGSKINQLIFAGWGEPLLHRDVFEIIKRFNSEINIPIKMNVNGLTSTKDKLLRILNSGVAHIVYSLNAVDSYTYDRLMMEGAFEKSLDKLDALIDYRNTLNVDTIIRVQLFNPWVRDYSNKLKIVLAKLDGLKDQIMVREVENKMGLTELVEFDHQKIDASLSCPTIWNGLTVDCSGDIYICCNSLLFRKSAGLYMGNIKEKSIAKFLSQEPRKKFIELNKSGNLYHIKECAACNMPLFCQKNIKPEWL